MAKIFVVDNSDAISRACKEYLAPAGHDVVVFKSAKEALKRIKALAPDLGIVDSRLKDMSGSILVQKLREQGFDFPVLLCFSGSSTPPAGSEPAQGFLYWPFSKAGLCLRVEALLGGAPEAASGKNPIEGGGLSWENSSSLIHHMRNHVGCLAGLLDMLKTRRGEKAFFDQYLNLAQQAIDNSANLLDQYAPLIQPVVLQYETIPVEAWLKEMVQRNPALRGSKVSVVWHVERGSLVPMSVDPGQLAVAVHAILENAVESMPEGGELRIGAYGHASKRWNYLTFQDAGIGMDDFILEHAIVPFFSMKRNKHGVGLSWARKIVSAHGGVLDISSAVQSGTLVVMKIPTRAPVKE